MLERPPLTAFRRGREASHHRQLHRTIYRHLHESATSARIADWIVPIPDTILGMQSWRFVVAVCLAASLSWAADQPPAPPPTTLCANGVPGAPACVASPQARQDARKAFDHGMKLQKQNRLEDAFLEFETAANLVPQDLQYATLRELTRQQLVSDHLNRGNTALADGREIEALGEFRNALHLDPHNDFAQERVQDAIRRSGGDEQSRRTHPRAIRRNSSAPQRHG